MIWGIPDAAGLPRLRGQYFGADGRPAGSDFALDSENPYFGETEASLATDAAGRYVVAWSGGNMIFARRFPAPP